MIHWAREENGLLRSIRTRVGDFFFLFCGEGEEEAPPRPPPPPLPPRPPSLPPRFVVVRGSIRAARPERLGLAPVQDMSQDKRIRKREKLNEGLGTGNSAEVGAEKSVVVWVVEDGGDRPVDC